MKEGKRHISPTRRELIAAAEWLARRDAGFTPETCEEFESWLRADERNARAWREIEASWVAYDSTRGSDLAVAMIHELEEREAPRRRRVLVGGMAVLAAAAAGLLFLVRSSERAPMASAKVARPAILSQPDRRLLADGSLVDLNMGGEVEVTYQATRRDLRLVRGEAKFTVAKNPTRPFVVTASTVQVRAVGTKFAVRLDPAAVTVLVAEGKVLVDFASANQTTNSSSVTRAQVAVPAGSRIVVPTASLASAIPVVEVLSTTEIERLLAWCGPRLELTGALLSDVVALLNHENEVQLSIANSALAKMRMSGVFRADDAEGFAHLLEADYGVRIERHGREKIELR